MADLISCQNQQKQKDHSHSHRRRLDFRRLPVVFAGSLSRTEAGDYNTLPCYRACLDVYNSMFSRYVEKRRTQKNKKQKGRKWKITKCLV